MALVGEDPNIDSLTQRESAPRQPEFRYRP